ncbi:hypothetical protein [Aquimarina algicola]|uniref:PBCV-specific basic adaptor domain-containing protein n=1 Tax=Aquimarina algicola TaxID=2589995 RepID=A0A504J460_9FLAO|nr:hypothetical protein [Aquimarina algicola]TPN82373.1 hypothetical protein FHK87_23420 [Aquimarina algicola]
MMNKLRYFFTSFFLIAFIAIGFSQEKQTASDKPSKEKEKIKNEKNNSSKDDLTLVNQATKSPNQKVYKAQSKRSFATAKQSKPSQKTANGQVKSYTTKSGDEVFYVEKKDKNGKMIKSEEIRVIRNPDELEKMRKGEEIKEENL